MRVGAGWVERAEVMGVFVVWVSEVVGLLVIVEAHGHAG